MSNQIVISSGAKVRELEGVLTGTAGIVNALSINVPNGIPQLDSNGKILVNQLPNSVMEYKGTWNVSTNTPTLVNGVGNQGDVYLVEGAAVGGTAFNFGAGPIIFFNGDQVVYSGSIWQRASGSTGTVTSVAVTESGDALSITGSPITTSGTINIGFAGNSGQYVNGAGGLTTFPTNNITGSGASGQVTYFNGTNTITGENAFNYDASTNRLGVNTTVPNATIGANAGTDSGYSLLLKNDNANYNGIGFGTDSTYGNLIATEKLGTAPARNLTLLNQSGYISITEVGNLGVNILNPNTGLDIYNGTSSYLWLHTANSGITGTDGVRLALFSTNTANLRNFEGAMSITSEGDFSVITLGDENFRVNSSDGSIYQAKVPNAMLKSVSGVITAAVAGTDYVAPSALSAYVPYTGATTNVNLGTFDLTADVITGATGSFASSGSGNTFAINHSSGSGIALNITKGGNGEGLYINKTSGSGNAATIIGTLNATTIVKDGGTSSQYLMADGSVTTSAGFITGSGVDGRVPYFNGTSSITSEAGFIYDASTNRLGVNTSVPNATIGADAALNSGYGLLIKTGASNYNGIGIAIDSTYGNTIETAKLGTASARNLTLLNQSGFVSLTESGAFGVGILTPNNGIDIYNSTQSQLWLHNAASGLTATDGVRLALFNNLSANLRNFDGGLSLTAEGDFSIITIGTENLKVNSANGFVAIGGPASITSMLTVNGAITQSSVTSALLKTNASGTLVAAVAGTDYVIPSGLSAYLPLAGGTMTGQIVLKEATNSTDFSKGLRFPNDPYGGSGDVSGLRLYPSSGENMVLELYTGNDGPSDAINFATGVGGTANNDSVTINGNRIWNAGNLTPQTQLNGTGFVKASGTTISYDNTSYLPLTGGTLTGALGGTSAAFSSGLSATSTSGLFKEGFRINASTTGGGGSQPAYTYYTAAGSKRWSSFLNVGDDTFNISNASNSEVFAIQQSGDATIIGTAPILGIKSTTTGNIFLRMFQGVDVVSSMFYQNSTSALNISNNIGGIRCSTGAVSGAFVISNDGAAAFSSRIQITSNGVVNPVLAIRQTNASNQGYDFETEDVSVGRLDLYGVTSSGRVQMMTWLKSSGRVGIGTSSPSTKLHVQGSFTQNDAIGYGLLENTSTSSGTADTNVSLVLKNFHGTSQFMQWEENGMRIGSRIVTNGGAGSLYFTTGNDSVGMLLSGSNLNVTGALSKGSGSFRIDHPLESMTETHQLVHSFVEAPQADLYYRGKLTLVNGKGQANIDEVATMTEGTFEALCREVQCFTTNESGWDLIKGKVIGNIIYIESQNQDSTDEISWLVIGERKDKHMMDTNWTDENGKVIVEPLKELIKNK